MMGDHDEVIASGVIVSELPRQADLNLVDPFGVYKERRPHQARNIVGPHVILLVGGPSAAEYSELRSR